MENVLPRSYGPEWDGHLMLLHDSEPDRLSSLAAWICRGLDRGDKVIYAEAPRPSGGSVLDLPDEWGVDLAAAVADGRLATLPLEWFYRQGDQEAVVDRALAEGFRSVRLAAEASATFGTELWPAHLAIERTIDRRCGTRPVSALCQYARATTTPAMLRELVVLHEYRLHDTALSMAADPQGLVVRGEVDHAHAGVFATALGAATARGDRVVRLDLAGLRFIDVAACRMLVSASSDFRQAGGHVVLAAPPWPVDWTLRLLGVDQFTGIDLVRG